MKTPHITALAAASVLFLSSFPALAHEPAMQQVAQQQTNENWDPNRPLTPEPRKGQLSDFPKGKMKNLEPVVPVGPGIGAAGVVPVVALERLDGVETVTLDTPRGPVVVVSWPISGNVVTSDYNINFSALDTNQDGYVSLQEAQAMSSRSKAARQLSQNFAQGDMNNDDLLSMSEVIDWIY